ncbi:sulfite exporter TauE/SafE family protein [Lacibacter luteus]|uniref:Probable membrane transporter protein n=1 Tax=Lacibacter luteus TaxID=2508719 RepID=A0A4Q1CEG2_9BACT|nr:sulfite exporter TauE/SafE family protein [Lacibacter luteus]RXK57862.1 sulfite exporter TauE/SafE family protein [Lacibacter luteus]
MDILTHYSITQWLLVLLAAFIIGLGKAGLKGVDMLSVTIMALVFGGKSSTGIVLPLLCTADIAAVYYYNRHAQWNHFWKLVPWMAVGILLGVYLGKDMDEKLFRQLMAVIVVLTIAIVLFMELRKSTTVPKHPMFAAGTGLAAGFTTMMGNLAGAFANLYFLAMRLPKNDFIGTAAWLFLVINLFKLPFQVFYWKNITENTLLTDLMLLPALALGFLLGIKLVKKLQDSSYRKVVMLFTLIGSVLMLLKR